jgi:ABC-type branched-subunit amino acid transport system substrate-binding protein
MTLYGKLRSRAGFLGAVPRYAIVGIVLALMIATTGVFGEQSTASATSASRTTPAVKTIIVSGLGSTVEFGPASLGAQAYFNKVNASGVLKGIKIDYLGFTDDGGSPASTLSAVRQLVTQDHVFAIVPDASEYDPGSYLASQKVPFVGLPLDASYCSPTSKPSTSIWGFGFVGCSAPTNPSRVPDRYGALYNYVKSKSHVAHPAFVVFGNDNQSGQDFASQNAASAQGTGFKVVSAKGNLPTTVTDYTPYVEQWMTSNHGKPPQAIVCLAVAECIGAWSALKAAGYTGPYLEPFGNITAIAGLMAGTVSTSVYNTAPSPALTQMQDAMDAVTPNTLLSGFSNVPGYLSASMFVAALKKVGYDDTPQAVQKALATQTWQIKGLVGPIEYPASSVIATPWCAELLGDNADGSGYTILSPYTCTSKTYKYTK